MNLSLGEFVTTIINAEIPAIAENAVPVMPLSLRGELIKTGGGES